MQLQNIVKIIQNLENTLQMPLYLVGGAVRDLLLGKEIKDFDFTTSVLPEQTEMAIKKIGKKPYIIGKKFGTVGFRYDFDGLLGDSKKQIIEITTFRNDFYIAKNRKPEITYSDNIYTDLSRRDFTINSMAINSQGKIIDPFGGKQDLQNKTIKAVGNPKERFKEDPLRILRAIRFAGKLGFEIEPLTLKKIMDTRFSLLNISKERWVLEIDQILQIPDPTLALDYLMNTEVIQVILPEIRIQKDFDQDSPYHDFDLWSHTKKVIANTPFDNSDTRWAALLHDVAKPATKIKNNKGYSNYIGHDLIGFEMTDKILTYLKFSKDRKETIKKMVLEHLSPDSKLKKYDDMSKKI